MIKRKGSAVWKGNTKTGNGQLTTPSGVLKDTPYSFTTRFGDEHGTNPEELIAAAHAGCFCMALSVYLGKAGFTADTLHTTANIIMEDVDGSKTITKIELVLEANIPNISQEEFMEAANQAKTNCPVSKVLKAEISLNAKLV